MKFEFHVDALWNHVFPFMCINSTSKYKQLTSVQMSTVFKYIFLRELCTSEISRSVYMYMVHNVLGSLISSVNVPGSLFSPHTFRIIFRMCVF